MRKDVQDAINKTLEAIDDFIWKDAIGSEATDIEHIIECHADSKDLSKIKRTPRHLCRG